MHKTKCLFNTFSTPPSVKIGLGHGFRAKNRRNCRPGFTLAEVLITLVIIGVIAALTIPNLMHNYRTKELKTGFLKCYRNISEVTKLMTSDLGVENLAETYVNDEKRGTFVPIFEKYFRVVKTIPYGNNAENKKFGYKNYTGNYTYTWNHADLGSPYSSYSGIFILSDGSSMSMQLTSNRIWFVVDINGPYKRPNRQGYDLFTFYIDKKKPVLQLHKQVKLYTPEELATMSYSYLSGHPCSENSSQEYNGVGCAWYAFHDINPDDSSKPYWKSLKW